MHVENFFPTLLLVCMQAVELNHLHKWKMIFRMLDVDNDGVVSDVDVLRLFKRAVFSKNPNPSPPTSPSL